MNTRYLKEFLVIAEELNFSAAAKRLYTTRPTLSEHLAELEDELGCKLVERGRGKPALTPAWEAVPRHSLRFAGAMGRSCRRIPGSF